MNRIIVGHKDRDWVDIEFETHSDNIILKKINGYGCYQWSTAFQSFKEKFKLNIKSADLEIQLKTLTSNHSDILLRELCLKLLNKWQYPYLQEELCHCRKIPTQIVDQAIIDGSHSIEEVAKKTTAGTGCGSCQPTTKEIIKFRSGI